MGVNEVALGLTLSIAALTDWREQKIYNKLLIPAFLFALVIHTFQSGLSGFTSSLMGAFIGFVLLLLPYILGGMGAGDVKLLAVIGAFGGSSFVLTSFLYGAIIGGLISVLLLARRKVLGNALKDIMLIYPLLQKRLISSEVINDDRHEKFPYGIAIVLGTLALLLTSGGVVP